MTASLEKINAGSATSMHPFQQFTDSNCFCFRQQVQKWSISFFNEKWQWRKLQFIISSSGSNQFEGDILSRTVHLMPDMLRKGHSQLRELHLDQCGQPLPVQSANLA